MTLLMPDDIMAGGFDTIVGTRRGHPDRYAATNDWSGLLQHMRSTSSTRPADTAALATTLEGALHLRWGVVMGRFAVACGAAERHARRIVVYNGKKLHLTVEDHKDTSRLHPESLCGRTLLRESVREARRGAWNAPGTHAGAPPVDASVQGATRCSKCARHQDQVPDTQEVPDGHPALRPEDHRRLRELLAGPLCQLAANALQDPLSLSTVQARADEVYRETFVTLAVKLLSERPVHGRRAAFPDSVDLHHLTRELHEQTGYPGTVDELLDAVDWDPLLRASAPTHPTDFANTTLTQWEARSARLQDALQHIAGARAGSRRILDAQRRVSAAQTELTAARRALVNARRANA